MFIGCNLLKAGGAKIYQPIKALGQAILCNITNYSSGDNVPFVGDPLAPAVGPVPLAVRAPLYMRDDCVEVDTQGVQTITAGWYSEITFETFIDNGYFQEWEGADSSILNISMTGNNIRVTGNNATGTDSLFIFVGPITGKTIIGLEYDGANMIVTKNGSALTPLPWDLSPGFNYNVLRLACRTPYANQMEGLIWSGGDSNVGMFDLVSNQTDGKMFRSDKGFFGVLGEDVDGESQINPDGTSSTAYVWPEDTKVVTPAVGAMHFVQDYLKASFATVNIADGTDRFLRGKIKLDTSLNSTVMIHNYTGADNVSPSCRLQYEVANGIRGLWFDDNNVLKGTTDWISVSLDVELTYNFIFNSSSTMNLTINGVSGVPRAATNGGSCNVFAEYCGAYSATLFRAPLYAYEFDSCIVGFSNTVNRLRGATDPRGNIIDTTTEIDRIVTDNAPFGIWYPYELDGVPVQWPTDFLVDDRYQIGDTCVTVPAGETLLQNRLTGNFIENRNTENLVVTTL